MKTGDVVQTPFGKGTIREIQNNNRVLVDVKNRSLVLKTIDLSPLKLEQEQRDSITPRPNLSSQFQLTNDIDPLSVPSKIDLHGLTVEAALTVVEKTLDSAMLAGSAEFHFIHGRSGGRIRAALHRRLKEISSVRSFQLDPRNAGITIVVL